MVLWADADGSGCPCRSSSRFPDPTSMHATPHPEHVCIAHCFLNVSIQTSPSPPWYTGPVPSFLSSLPSHTGWASTIHKVMGFVVAKQTHKVVANANHLQIPSAKSVHFNKTKTKPKTMCPEPFSSRHWRSPKKSLDVTQWCQETGGWGDRFIDIRVYKVQTGRKLRNSFVFGSYLCASEPYGPSKSFGIRI